MAKMMEGSTVLRSLALIMALLAAGFPGGSDMQAASTSGAVHPDELERLEHMGGLVNDSAANNDHTVFLPVVHGPPPYPPHPPQIEPGVGEYFSHWLLLDYDIEYGVWEDIGYPSYIEPGDPVIEVTARLRNDSDVDYYAWVTGTSYDAEGDPLTGTIWLFFPHPSTRLVRAHEAADFTFHMKPHRAITLIRLNVVWSVEAPP